MRIGVTGGRKYANLDKIYETLRLFDNAPIGGNTLVVGDATGADALASGIVSEQFYWNQERFVADWTRYGLAAGPRRNREMVDSGLDVLIAFPGGKGTEDMKTKARQAGILVLEVS